MFWIPLAMAAAGAAKSELIDRPQENRDRELAAKTQELSPWTGLAAKQVREANTFGNTLQGGMTGLALAQGIEQHKADLKMKEALAEEMRRPKPPVGENGPGTLFGQNQNASHLPTWLRPGR
jgi:hypothetical protein